MFIIELIGIGHCAGIMEGKNTIGTDCAFPVRCASGVKLAREGTEVKDTCVIAADVVGVIGGTQRGKGCILREVKRGELVIGTYQIGQCGVITYIQFSKLIVIAIKYCECGVIAKIQLCEFIKWTIKRHKICVVANIKFCKLI